MIDEENSSARDEVTVLLQRAFHDHGVLARLAPDRSSLELGNGVEPAPTQLLAALRNRSQEIIAHLLGSPGLHIVGYPADLMLASHGFQEIRIAERRKRNKVVDVLASGQTVTKWFDDVPASRMREIARELEEWIPIRQRELAQIARSARSRAKSPQPAVTGARGRSDGQLLPFAPSAPPTSGSAP